jgi:sec-independent protein translocase protein TatB
VLDNLDAWKLGVLLLLGIFLFGPERLPNLVMDAVRILRSLRQLARGAAADLSREVGVDLTAEDLHPRTFIRKHLLDDDEQARLLAPLRDTVDQVRRAATPADDTTDSTRPHPTESKPTPPSGALDPDAT